MADAFLTTSANRKSVILGMPLGTAANRLRKSVLFMLVQKCGMAVCHRCSEEIEIENELSIEHKASWQLSDDPIRDFFDLKNIAFSHLRCNSSAAKRTRKKYDTDRGRKRVYDRKNYETRIVKRDAWRQRRREAGLPYS